MQYGVGSGRRSAGGERGAGTCDEGRGHLPSEKIEGQIPRGDERNNADCSCNDTEQAHEQNKRGYATGPKQNKTVESMRTQENT